MAEKLTVGDVTAVAGKIQYGRWEARPRQSAMP